VAINYRLVVVPVAISVVISLNDYSVPIAMFVTITDHCTVVISIAVAVMPSADCYADRTDTDSNLFRTRRHCSTNSRNGGNYQSVFHHILLTL
jgi:orotate phosphoribosyltransferase-like protein